MSYEIVRKFEKTIAEFAGAKYGIAISSCTNAIFLCCQYLKVKDVYIPKYTYPGVVFSILHAGGKIHFQNKLWLGIYQLEPYLIYDSALSLRPKMYIKDSFFCLSFHAKKHIPIGRGGMILCDDKKATEWFKRARFDGRSECPLSQEQILTIGWNMYMTPEQAARGLMLFEIYKEKDDFSHIDVTKQNYPDLSKFKIFQNG